jgi:hypothetical protein
MHGSRKLEELVVLNVQNLFQVTIQAIKEDIDADKDVLA